MKKEIQRVIDCLEKRNNISEKLMTFVLYNEIAQELKSFFADLYNNNYEESVSLGIALNFETNIEIYVDSRTDKVISPIDIVDSFLWMYRKHGTSEMEPNKAKKFLKYLSKIDQQFLSSIIEHRKIFVESIDSEDINLNQKVSIYLDSIDKDHEDKEPYLKLNRKIN